MAGDLVGPGDVVMSAVRARCIRLAQNADEMVSMVATVVVVMVVMVVVTVMAVMHVVAVMAMMAGVVRVHGAGRVVRADVAGWLGRG